MFAQQFREMLTQTTFESFRAYSLDTIARLKEALELVDDVLGGHIPEAAIETALDELSWSLTQDPIAGEHIQSTMDSFARCHKSPRNLRSVRAHIVLMLKQLNGDYKQHLEKHIVQLANLDNKRSALRVAIAFYCSHLINLGYSKPFLLACTNEAFFNRDMRRANRATLPIFFRRFSGKPKPFLVFTDLSDSFAHYLTGLQYSIKRKARLSRDVQDAFQGSSFAKALESKVTAFDPYSAMLSVQRNLSSVRAMTYLSPFGLSCEWVDAMYVKGLRSAQGATWSMEEVAFDRPTGRAKPSGRRMKNVRTRTKNILNNFDEESTKRLFSSINTAALARSTSDMENQLISMWAAVEVMLSKPEGRVRITHFIDLMVPCICTSHIRRQISAFYDALVVANRKRLTDLLKEAIPTDPLPSQLALASILLLPNPLLQRQLSEILKNNPLALQRLSHAKKSFNNRKSIRHSIDSHEQRVRWQLSRIYRVRNSLVHAGRAPSYLDSILLNLTEYYRTAVTSIVRKAKSENHESQIDQIIAEIGIDYASFKGSFSGDTALTFSDVERLVALQ